MKGQEILRNILRRINGKSYNLYKELEGSYDFGNFIIFIDHVQDEASSQPSRIRVKMPQSIARFPQDTFKTKSREIALRDYITRLFDACSASYISGSRGSGNSGLISIEKPAQEIFERNSACIDQEHVEVRFVMGLPAFGRKIVGLHADEMFFVELPDILTKCMLYGNLDAGRLKRHIECAEDADYLRSRLKEMKLISFIEDGSHLPRRSGVDNAPFEGKKIIPFQSPEEYKVTISLPNSGEISGMGIPEGITLITGGGFQGKSTLLKAVGVGVYNHIPGDGRERVVTVEDAVKVRAEEGRRVEKVDVSPFISHLPFDGNTAKYSAEDSGGALSQAVNIIEAVEAGCSCLLIDEDSSALNLMIRDQRMQHLISCEDEPITPFLDKARSLYEEYSVSTILVMGGAGEYLDIADHVICMKEYRPSDVTGEARKISLKYKGQRKFEGGNGFGVVKARCPSTKSIEPLKGNKAMKVECEKVRMLRLGAEMLDLGAIEQLTDFAQTRAIGMAILHAVRYIDNRRTLREIIDLVIGDVADKGLDVLDARLVGEFAVFRKFELAAALNRMKILEISGS